MQEPSHEMSSMELHIKQAPILWFGGMCPTIAPQPPVHIPPSAAWSAKAGDEFHLLSLACKQDWNVSSIDRIEPHIIIAKICQNIKRHAEIMESWLCFLFEQPAPSREFPRWLQGIID